MTTGPLSRLVVRMDGFPGSPGFMTFYAVDASLLQPAVVTFLNAIKSSFPADVTFTVPAEGDVLDSTNGNLTGGWSSGTASTITGTATGGYPAPAGACISWDTVGIVTGASGRSRRLRGRTFLVPLVGLAFDGDGSLGSATLSQLRTAASGLWVAAALCIWHRPTSSSASDGSYYHVTGSNVKDRAAILTSRRA